MVGFSLVTLSMLQENVDFNRSCKDFEQNALKIDWRGKGNQMVVDLDREK